MKGENPRPGKIRPPTGGTGAVSHAKKQHRFESIQSITTMRLMQVRVKAEVVSEEVATVIRVWRDQKKLQPNYQIDDQDLWDAIANIDPFYRDIIMEKLIDLPGVRRVEMTDAIGCGFVVEN